MLHVAKEAKINSVHFYSFDSSALSLSLALTHTHSHTHTQSHTHTHKRSRSLCNIKTPTTTTPCSFVLVHPFLFTSIPHPPSLHRFSDQFFLLKKVLFALFSLSRTLDLFDGLANSQFLTLSISPPLANYGTSVVVFTF